MNLMFHQDMEDYEEIKLVQWKKRSVFERIEESISGSMEPLL